MVALYGSSLYTMKLYYWVKMASLDHWDFVCNTPAIIIAMTIKVCITNIYVITTAMIMRAGIKKFRVAKKKLRQLRFVKFLKIGIVDLCVVYNSCNTLSTGSNLISQLQHLVQQYSQKQQLLTSTTPNSMGL